jgi:hypothetical protein
MKYVYIFTTPLGFFSPSIAKQNVKDSKAAEQPAKKENTVKNQ